MQMKLGRYATRGQDIVVIDEYIKPKGIKPKGESTYLRRFCWGGYFERDGCSKISHKVNSSWDNAGRFMIDGSISQNDLVRYIGPLETDEVGNSDFRFVRMIEAVHIPVQDFSGVTSNDE